MSDSPQKNICNSLQAHAMNDGKNSRAFWLWRLHSYHCSTCKQAINSIDELASTEQESSISSSKQTEMLNTLYDNMQSRYGASQAFTTRILNLTWKITAAAVIIFCGAWLLMPQFRNNTHPSKPQTSPLNVASPLLEDSLPLDTSFDDNAISLHNKINEAIIEMDNTTDWELTGF